MGEELILTRNRFILDLLRQNFVRVDGPRLEDEKSIVYDVWNRKRDPGDENCVRIAFDRGFLREAGNDFARATLQALRDAKGLLHAAGGRGVRTGASKEKGEAALFGDDSGSSKKELRPFFPTL